MKKIDTDKASELLKDLKYSLFTPEFVSDEEAEMLYHTIIFWRSNSNEYKEQNKGCFGCIHLGDTRRKCESCARFGHVDHYVSST